MKKLITYDEEPSGFSHSQGIKDFHYKLLTEAEKRCLHVFYSTSGDADAETSKPPAQIVNLIAQLKLFPDIKEVHIMKPAVFTWEEAALMVVFAPVSGKYDDREYLCARWSTGDKPLMPFEEIRSVAKDILCQKRKAELLAGLKTVEQDADQYINNGTNSYISF